MEMKKSNKTKLNCFNRFWTFVLIALSFFGALMFNACGSTNKLNMPYYTLEKSSYTLINNSTNTETNSTDFISSTPILRQYQTITINLSSEWLYGFHIEKLAFSVKANHAATIEFNITITNVTDGEIDSVVAVKSKTFPTTCKLNIRNDWMREVNNDFGDIGKITQIRFTITNTELFTEHEDFAFAIYNVALFGEHSVK